MSAKGRYQCARSGNPWLGMGFGGGRRSSFLAILSYGEEGVRFRLAKSIMQKLRNTLHGRLPKVGPRFPDTSFSVTDKFEIMSLWGAGFGYRRLPVANRLSRRTNKASPVLEAVNADNSFGFMCPVGYLNCHRN